MFLNTNLLVIENGASSLFSGYVNKQECLKVADEKPVNASSKNPSLFGGSSGWLSRAMKLIKKPAVEEEVAGRGVGRGMGHGSKLSSRLI